MLHRKGVYGRAGGVGMTGVRSALALTTAICAAVYVCCGLNGVPACTTIIYNKCGDAVQ